MLREIFEKGYYAFYDGFDNWEDAVRASVQPLVDKGAVKKGYADSIVKCVKEFGPYIVIAPNICIPHAQDRANVMETAVGFMKSNSPVHFSEDPEHSAQLFFVLASSDEKVHLENLQRLSDLLSNQDLVTGLLRARNVAEFELLLRSFQPQ